MDGNKKSYRFFFRNPKPEADAETLAEKLIALKDIEEVLLTEKSKGYIVKAKFYAEMGHEAAIAYMQKNVGSVFGEINIA